MMGKFIDLNRSFVEIPKDHNFHEEDYDLSSSFGLLKTKKWKDLLLLHRVIILAEAGAGKTEEIRASTKRLRDDGKKAFFLRLEHLSSNFEASFEIGNDADFVEWQASDEDGWFFLDSVDEARLCGTKQFEAAVRQFGIKLGDSKQRAHIFITSRLSEWRAQEDLSLIKDRIPFIKEIPPAKQQNGGDINAFDMSSRVGTTQNIKVERERITPIVFALRPLDKNQIRIFSQTFGVQYLDDFLMAIERAEADIFSSRPQDLVELINYWKQYGGIANRAKLIEASIYSKLNEPDPDRAASLPLKQEKAIYGAEMLAAAVTFQRKTRILVPEQNPDYVIKAEAMDVQGILTTWNHLQIQALLQRPIFDEAIYGTVRFHHRSVCEYLTAKWLHRLLLQGKPRHKIETLFFKDRYGRMVLVPSMRPILAWLILFDDRIRDKTAELAPEVFIQGGDPASLPTDIRKNMLRTFCETYADKKVTYLSFDISEVRRFAHPDLAETINHLLEIHSDNEEIRELLLRIAWQGEIEACSEKAMTFALDRTNDVHTRIYGIRVINATGSEDQKKKIVKGLISDPNINSEPLIGELIEAFAPDMLGIRDILNLIPRIEKSERYSYSWIRHALKEFSQHKCPDADIIEWIRGLLTFLKQTPVIERRYFEVSQKYSWVLPYAILAAERLVRIKHPNALDESVIAVISLSQAGQIFHDYPSEKHALAELVPKWPELNRALFWFDVASVREQQNKKNDKPLTEWWRVSIFDHHYWRFIEEDFRPILDDIVTKFHMDDRLVALSLAFQIYKENGRGRARRLQLKKAVQGVPELEKALNLYLKPPPMSDEVRRWRKRDATYKKRQDQRDKKKAENRRRWREWLQTHTDVLRDTSIAPKGSVWSATRYLMDELHNKRPDSNKWANSNWEDLISEFGQDVAEAYRDGCIGYWRNYRPKIRSEGIDNPNSTPSAVVVGLSGLAMESRHILDWPKNLSRDEANLVCRYAFHELNGFPDWLPDFHALYPDTVESAILAEVEWEFSQYDGEALCHYVLDDVVWQSDWLKPKISSQILSLIEHYEPKHDDTVQKALEIVFADPCLDQIALVKIAKKKVMTVSSGNRQLLWLATWMRVDAKSALEPLSSILGQSINAEQATESAMQFLVALLGGRRDPVRSEHQDFNRPEILLPLIKTMHSYIRSTEDIHRAGTGVYSPGLRDHAQESRGQLFQLLRNIPGKPTYLALMDLAQHHPDEDSREWHAVNAKRRAEEDAENEPWQPGDIGHFAEEAERTPNNHRELFEMTVSRLLDLKAELEDGDTSIAEILQSVRNETKHRNWIGGWLRDRSLGRYSVPQEEELADAKKPDMRIHGIGFDGPVPIELKIADNWSGTKLIERLNNQLCKDYLRDIRSNCGIFLIVYRGEKTYWEHPITGTHMNFHDLILLLEAEAGAIEAKDNKVESIEIVGIDLMKRTGKKL